MFKISNQYLVSLSLIILSAGAHLALAQTAPTARSGHGAGNGGNSLASGFVDIARRVGKSMRMICGKTRNSNGCAGLNPYFIALPLTEVTTEEHVFGSDGKEREAVNNGTDHIVLSESKWQELIASSDSSERALRTVIHEYLSIAGVESSDHYETSLLWISQLKENNFSIISLAGSIEVNLKTKTFEHMEAMIEIGALYNLGDDDSGRLGFCRLHGYKSVVNYVRQDASREHVRVVYLRTDGDLTNPEFAESFTSSVTCSK
jgi:hypothetical protein